MYTWSRYNHIFHSNKYGKLLYNSRTNSLIKLSDKVFDLINENKSDISNIPEILQAKLKEVKAIVGEYDDNNYLLQKKCATYANSFSKEVLGLTIATTTNCNFRCSYCYEEGAEKSNMKRNVEEAIIKLIEDNPAKSVFITWYGGEPLLNFKTIKYLMNILKNEYKEKKINYTIVTNGYLLDKNKVNFLKEFKIGNIQITLDGLKDTNDRTRIAANGKGSFDMIMKNLSYAITEMPDSLFSIRVNTDRGNMDEYPKLYTFLKTSLNGPKNLRIYHHRIIDYSGNTPNCVSRNEEYIYNKFLLNTYGIKDTGLYPSFKIGGCVASSINGFVINPDGSICRCWVEIGKKDKITGSIMKNSSIKPNALLISKYMVENDMFDNEKCKKCFFLPNCDGGCSYQRVNYGFKKTCPHTKKEIETYLELQYERLYLTQV